MNIQAKNSHILLKLTQPLTTLHAIGRQLVAMVMGLESWRRGEQTSMQFAYIDARTLRDAGISEAQRFIVVHRPFDE